METKNLQTAEARAVTIDLDQVTLGDERTGAPWITPDGITLLDGALVFVTGAKGTGKSLFASTVVGPKDAGRVYYDDSEYSSNRTNQELIRLQDAGLTKRFGVYNDLESMFADDLPTEKDLLYNINRGRLPWVDGKQKSALQRYYEETLLRLDRGLVRGQYLVYVHDTIAKLEAGMAAWVEKHRGYGKGKAGWSSSGYGRMWSEAVYPLYEQLIKSIFDRGVKIIVFSAHLKTPWIGEGKSARPVPGKVVPQGKKVLAQQSSLMLWLVKDHNNWDGAPAGIILKQRLHKMNVTSRGRWRNRTSLPSRIPHCVWWEDLPEPGETEDDVVPGSIERYLRDGVRLRHLTEGEQVSVGEAGMIRETLNPAQMKYMISTAATDLERERQYSRKMGLPATVEIFDAQQTRARKGIVAQVDAIATAKSGLVEQVKERWAEAAVAGLISDEDRINFVLSKYAPPTHTDVRAAIDQAKLVVIAEAAVQPADAN